MDWHAFDKNRISERNKCNHYWSDEKGSILSLMVQNTLSKNYKSY